MVVAVVAVVVDILVWLSSAIIVSRIYGSGGALGGCAWFPFGKKRTNHPPFNTEGELHTPLQPFGNSPQKSEIRNQKSDQKPQPPPPPPPPPPNRKSQLRFWKGPPPTHREEEGSQGVDFRFQISDFRFLISDF